MRRRFPLGYETATIRRSFARTGGLHIAGRCLGFTVVELVVVVGMVFLLMGIFMPVLGNAVGRARMTSDAGAIRQNFVAVSLYMQDHREVYPLARRNAFHATTAWHEPLLSAGYAERPEDIDPRSFRRLGQITFRSSLCMVYDPHFMRPGWELPVDEAVARAVHQYQVAYPSQKGYLFKEGDDGYITMASGNAWCCGDLWVFPVAMADGAVLFGDYMDFSANQPVVVGAHGIGMSVFSTWGGYLGRDL